MHILNNWNTIFSIEYLQNNYTFENELKKTI